MVMEFVPYGDLKHYLQNLRKQVALLEFLNAKSSADGGSVESEELSPTGGWFDIPRDGRATVHSRSERVDLLRFPSCPRNGYLASD